jgi:hypothetical protein
MMIFKYALVHISSPYIFPTTRHCHCQHITGAPRVATSNGQSPETVPRNAGDAPLPQRLADDELKNWDFNHQHMGFNGFNGFSHWKLGYHWDF